MITILPFEQAFYQQFGYKVHYAGHPLLDALHQHESVSRSAFLANNQLPDKPIIALLPGSRKQEIRKMLAEMLKVLPLFPQYQFIVGMAPSVNSEFYKDIAKNAQAKFIQGGTYQLLEHAEAALVTSGTASLETALLNVPEVICYKGSYISYLIARMLIKIQFIGLPNLIMQKLIVKELIQNDLNTENLNAELAKLLDKNHVDVMKHNYNELRQRLGGQGASARAAEYITQLTTTSK
jgi:lipid-A-disaccharide synthase